MRKSIRVAAVLLIWAALLPAAGSSAYKMSAAPQAGVPPPLGVAETFRVLGAETVTNTGPTVIDRDLGIFPGSAVTGFPPGIVKPPGVIHSADAVAQQAQTAVTTAYNALAGQACDVNLTGQDLGGLTLIPGVYCFDTSAQMTGQLRLNVQGNASAVFIFKIGSTLTTASNSSVVFVNGGPSCNVFWQIGSSATLGTATAFQGTVLAQASITLNTGASMNGRALARTGAVTLDTNNVSLICPVAPPPTNTPVPVVTNTPVPIPTGAPTNTPVPIPTNTPVPVPTNTPVPAPTGAPTNTPVPVVTNTPVPIPTNLPTNTPVPIPTNTPVPVPTNTPVPLAVELLYFVVSRDGQAVVLDWATAEEVDNYGFNLYRAAVDDFTQAALIHFAPSAIQGGTGAGATYRYRDTLPAEGAWWYWLVDVDTHGIETIHNPSVVIAERLRFQVYLPLTGK